MRPEHSETKAKTETRECETEIETETETKKVVSRPCWSRDLNIPADSIQLWRLFPERLYLIKLHKIPATVSL